MSRNLAEENTARLLSSVTHRVRQLERRPCSDCGAEQDLQTYRKVSDASTNAAVIAACPAIFFGHQLGNSHEFEFRYVHLFDRAVAPSTMADVKLTLSVPWESGANQEYPDGIEFETGLAIAFSTSPSSLVAVESSLVIANIAYSANCPTTPAQFTGLATMEDQSFFIEQPEGLPDVP